MEKRAFLVIKFSRQSSCFKKRAWEHAAEAAWAKEKWNGKLQSLLLCPIMQASRLLELLDARLNKLREARVWVPTR